ncbi:hypothetical protein CMI37_25055 [Candidatus Pacearchaeota archaeon]|nr:hypothetical protein [Candidatus Pacearchaeota archaeon]
MPSSTEYNGYTNYETWLLCLNLDTDEGLYKLFNNYEGTADDLKEELEKMFCHVDEIGYKICDFWSNRDWAEINWQEVLETRAD